MTSPLVIDGDHGERDLSLLEVDGADSQAAADITLRIQQAIERGYDVAITDLPLGGLRIAWRKL